MPNRMDFLIQQYMLGKLDNTERDELLSSCIYALGEIHSQLQDGVRLIDARLEEVRKNGC